MHHATNRGISGEHIFTCDAHKTVFLELLAKKAKLNGIRVFAYCLMDNHYHLVLENTSGRLSLFFKQLNGHYGLYYRRQSGSNGYVFQSRFYSSLIQDDAYLKLAILYVLSNPVQAGMAESALAYPWSSARLYFSGSRPEWLAVNFVEKLFGSRRSFSEALELKEVASLPVLKTKLGPIVGEEAFAEKAEELFNRRSNPESMKRMRTDDKYFDPVEKVIFEFERKHKSKTEQIDIGTHVGKRLRAELLVRLRDQAGMKYSEIVELPMFADLKFRSLGHIYKNAKKHESEKYKF
jgi:REP element-mobilizing transposase RayT